MATRIYEVLSFVNVGAGAQATLPHHINTSGVAQIPDFLYPDTGGFALVAADAESVTVQNNNVGAASLDLALFFIYSPERLFGQAISHLTPLPFFVSGGGASAPGANLWAPGTGAGSVLQNDGSGNLAGGIDSLAAGKANMVTGEASFAEGASNTETIVSTSAANGGANHIEGVGNAINVAKSDGGGFNHIEGTRQTLTATGGSDLQSNHVEGDHNTFNALGGPGNGISFNHIEGVNHVLATVAGTGACSFNHVEGSGTHLTVHATGDIEFSHFEGAGHVVVSDIDVDDTHVEGFGHVVTDADTTHIEGNQSIVNIKGGTANHIEGNQHTVGNGTHVINRVHVEGDHNTVTAAADSAADTSHVEGSHCAVSAKTAHAQGDSSSATRETQFSYASGKFAAAGDAQGSLIPALRGATPGIAGNETIELKFGAARDQTLQFEDNKAYTLIVEAAAVANTEAGLKMQSFTQNYAIRRVAGVSVIAGIGAADHFGDPDAISTTWTLVATIGAGPDRLVLTFSTGVTAEAVRCVATVRWVEVLSA